VLLVTFFVTLLTVQTTIKVFDSKQVWYDQPYWHTKLNSYYLFFYLSISLLNFCHYYWSTATTGDLNTFSSYWSKSFWLFGCHSPWFWPGKHYQHYPPGYTNCPL
jgi:hypothetical protein